MDNIVQESVGNTPVLPSTNVDIINALTIKPPTFNEAAIAGWFSIVEAQFHLQRITREDSKFFNVLAALPPETVNRLPQSVLSQHNYTLLRTEVTALYERTKPELFEKLIASTPLTGRPSAFLEELRRTALQVGVNDDLVRHKFIQALPQSIAPIAATQKELPLSQLGKLADELMPLARNQCLNVNRQEKPQISAVNNNLNSSISEQVVTRSDNKSNIPYGLRPFGSKQKPVVCRAHLYFGQRARTCKPWCQWPQRNKDIQMQPSSRPSSPVNNSSEN